MKILIDGFGCDDPRGFLSGIPEAIKQNPDVTLAVVGDKDVIEEILSGCEFDRGRLEIIDAKEVITNEDSPVLAIRMKKNSSLTVALKTLRDSEDIGVMITAGSTGAVIAGSTLILGREDREDRPTLVTLLPNDLGTITSIADCGANTDSRPEHLLKFATYASRYMASVYGIAAPKVALLSVGTEDEKGNELTKEAFKLLSASELNFVGNIEARTALSGEVDVIVTDGFSGNVLLKSIEGTAKSVIKRMVGMLMKHAKADTDTSFIKSAVGELLTTIDFNSMGGAIILGAKKPIIKGHGSANSDTLVNTVKQAAQIIKNRKEKAD